MKSPFAVFVVSPLYCNHKFCDYKKSAKGELEDFLRFLVPDGDPLFVHVEASLASIPPDQCRFSALKQPKAKIHTWLAWQEEPGKPFGQAITARYLDPSLPAADPFARWLQRTFFAS